jgi:hypothetical protein
MKSTTMGALCLSFTRREGVMVQENEKTRVYPGYLWLVTLSALACAACVGPGGAQQKETVTHEQTTVLPYPIPIDVVNGEVVAGSNGGNVRNSRHPIASWTSEYDFELEFSLFDEEEAPLRAHLDERWPFRQQKPKDGIVKIKGGGSFVGRLNWPANTNAVYKYNITVTTQTGEVHRLDPIIIIE